MKMVDLTCVECSEPFRVRAAAAARGAKYCSSKCRVAGVSRGNVRDPNARFWEKVERRSDSECWEWLAGCFADGYGAFSINGKPQRSHRVAYEIVVAPIPEGMHILHQCDNPKCVNPKHLSLGTHAENMADMATKGRHVGATKLTDDQVAEIREAVMPLKAIAAEYRVSVGLVGLIRGKAGHRVRRPVTVSRRREDKEKRSS